MQENGRAWAFRILGLCLGIGLLLLWIQRAGFRQFGRAILGASPSLLLASVAVYSSSWIFRTWRLSLLANHDGTSIGLIDLFKLHVAGYALNVLLPFKLGDAASIGFLKMKGVGLGRAAAIIFQTRVMDVTALLSLCIPASFLVPRKAAPAWMPTVILAAACIAAVPFCVVALDRGRVASAWLARAAAKLGNRLLMLIAEKGNDAYLSYHELAGDRKLGAASVGLSVLTWALEGLSGYAVAVAVIGPVSPLLVVLAISIGNLGKCVPITPGAVGIYESIVAAILHGFGIPLEAAIAIAILDNILKKLFTLSFGLASAFRMEMIRPTFRP